MEDGGDLKFHETLVKEVAEKFNMDLKEVEEIIKLDIRFIKEQTEDPNVTGIYVGKNLGTLYANKKKHVTEIRDKTKSKFEIHNNWVTDIFEPRLKIMNDFTKDYDLERRKASRYLKKPFIYLLKEKLKRKFNFSVNVTTNSDKLWTKVAEIQNDVSYGREE
jgi:nucleoid DNA-binding protein